jgi:hypothetical protein
MHKRVDTEVHGTITAYTYESKTGFEEGVRLNSGLSYATFFVSNGEASVDVYKSDIPKLILALQAAYDHKE